MEYTKAYKDEKPSQYLVDRHWHDIFPLMKKRYLFSGVDNFLFYDLWENGHVNENVFAYSNGAGDERAVVFYNNKYDRAAGWIKQSDPYAVKTGNGDEVVMMSRSISEGLNLTAEDDKYCIFQEHRSRLWFIRKSREVCEKGLFVMLNGFEYQVYLNVHQVSDQADHRYKILCEFLNGRGCEDIETAYRRTAKLPAKQVRLWPRVARYAAAASVIFFVGFGGYKYYQYDQTISLGAEYYQPMDAIYRSPEDNTLKELAKVFKNVETGDNLTETIAQLRKFYSLAKSDEYSDYSLYTVDIAWNLAVAHLKNNDRKEAIKVLEEIIQDNQGKAIADKAAELIKKIEKI